jgi:hypothetical protein
MILISIAPLTLPVPRSYAQNDSQGIETKIEGWP